MKNIKVKISIAFLLLLAIINYFSLIPLNPRYKSTFFVYVLIVIVLVLINSKNLIHTVTKYDQASNRYYKDLKMNKSAIKIFVIAGISLLIHFNSSLPIFFSRQYQKLIGEIKIEEFTKDFSAISTTQLPIVDHKYAELLGDKKLGEDRGLGSEFYVGTYTDIVMGDKLYLVAPLEYRDFFKWLGNKSKGTPGYIMVDKVTGEVELVREINGKPLQLKYMPTAYLNQDLKRAVYFNGNYDNLLYNAHFELDDQGNPFWVIPKTKLTIGISGGLDIKSVIILDPQTGEVNEYSIEDAPKWVDNIFPRDIVTQQLDYWGLYVNGYLNSIFGQKNVVSTTYGSRRVYNNGLYHYTGLTSIGGDESTVGFVFTSTRNKQTTYYSITGATEQAAMESAEGKVQNLRYRATFPIPMNINGIPTFFITLKDNKGLIKQYSFVNINDYSKVGNGETITKAREDYLKSMNQSIEIPIYDELTEVEGVIQRIGYSIVDGNTIFYILLDNGSIYEANTSVSSELAISKEGDSVKLEVADLKVHKFKNSSLDDQNE